MLKEFLTNPLKLTLLGLAFFILGVVDVAATGASSFDDTDVFGQVMASGVLVILGWLVCLQILIPLIKVLSHAFKKNNPNN